MRSKEYYPFLDGLRCFAILWVIIHHIYVNFLVVYVGDPIIKSLAFKFAWAGGHGVDLFFVISGFLITGLLLEKEANWSNIQRFYIRRCFKIFPSYYFLLLCLFCFSLYVKQIGLDLRNFSDIFYRYIIFIQNFFSDQSPLLGHLWSIAVEEHFYIFYPLLILFLSSDRDKRKLNLLVILISIIIISNITKFALSSHLTAGHQQSTFFRADAIIFGCIIKLLEERVLSLPNPKGFSGFLACCISGYLWWFLIDHGTTDVWYYYTIAYVASGFLIIACLLKVVFIKELLEYDLFRFIGKISYNLYLWHYPFIFITFFLVKDLPNFLIAIYLLFSFLIAWFITITIEKGFLKLRNQVSP
jgi:peptidoglycan/LPS O-acetylase OafA/YrhL